MHVFYAQLFLMLYCNTVVLSGLKTDKKIKGFLWDAALEALCSASQCKC